MQEKAVHFLVDRKQREEYKKSLEQDTPFKDVPPRPK
jgi:hypothetical protein